MCGKYFRILLLVKSPPGSPPRVWEVLTLLNIYWKPCRITPTCVGSTILSDISAFNLRDHPHVCGKYLFITNNKKYYLGSPPRVWEVQEFPSRPFNRRGITPTCVGSTSFIHERISCIWDHPHVCGKYTKRSQ